MNHTLSSFFTLLLMASYLFYLKQLLSFFRDLAFLHTANLWHVILRSIPSISSVNQTNISCAHKYSTSYVHNFSSNFEPIFIGSFFLTLIASKSSTNFYFPFLESHRLSSEVICMVFLSYYCVTPSNNSLFFICYSYHSIYLIFECQVMGRHNGLANLKKGSLENHLLGTFLINNCKVQLHCLLKWSRYWFWPVVPPLLEVSIFLL